MDRLRVVPHFSSGIVERAIRERENYPTREKARVAFSRVYGLSAKKVAIVERWPLV